jgi:hypothetical protein
MLTHEQLVHCLNVDFFVVKKASVEDANGSFRPILLKNSFAADDQKILAVIGSEARFTLGGYTEELMLRCGTL